MSQPVASPSPTPGIADAGRASFPASRSPLRRRSHTIALVATVLIMLLYGLHYGRLIALSTAVPTFDQAAYMLKTYHIADTVYAHPLQGFNPLTYFSEPYANRPPLLMAVAAIVLGPGATPQSIGILWLIIRLAVLFGALWLPARRLGDAGFLPAAALTILAAPGELILYPNMYMVDQAFEAFALLAFVLLTADEQQHTARSAALGALATLLLLLIKPAALVLLFPLYLLLVRRAIRILRAEPRPGEARRALVRWLWPYAILGGLMLLLLLTPHPPAVAYQYLLGARGYWATGKDFLRVTGLVALVIPPWLIAMSAISIILSGRRHIPLALPALAVVLWWFFFNAVISYTLDPRIISAAMPVAVVGALLAIVRSRRLTAAATVFAALTFALALGSASGDLPGTSRRFAAIFTPLVDPQEPPAEVGLLNVARQINQVITAAGADQDNSYRSQRLMLVTSDDFVENAAMHLAFRYTHGDPSIVIDAHPWGAENFRIDPPPSFSGVLNFEWFLTKQRRKEPAINPLQGDVFVPLYAVDALILAPESPLHGCFEKQCELPIRQMNNFEDTVTLWRLKEVPPSEKLLAALGFVQPRFKGTRGEQAIADQIARLAATVPGAQP